MFQRVGHRLALLNALVVIVIIIATGGVTYVALSQSLNREVDDALRDRIEAFGFPEDIATLGTPTPTRQSDGDDDEEDDDHDHQVVISGDTIVIVVNRDGKIVANPRSLHEDDIPVRDGIRAALHGDIDTRTVQLHDSGSVRVMTVPVIENGNVTGAIQAVRSLSEHEDELRLVQLIAILGAGLGILVAIPAGLYLARRAMRPINAAFQRQRVFVADASHELRTPLTLIRANADYALMDESKRVAEVQQELESILFEVDRTSRLVDGLLTLARADAGRLQLARLPSDLTRIAADTIEGMRPLFVAKHVDIQLSASDRLVSEVDPDRLAQVLRILLDNALKYTAAGGSVTVGISAVNNSVEIRVRDTGTGINPGDLPHIFDRFYRADQSRTRATGGSGLGLAIARTLVEAHAGHIRIESERDTGTTAIVTIPTSKPHPAD